MVGRPIVFAITSVTSNTPMIERLSALAFAVLTTKTTVGKVRCANHLVNRTPGSVCHEEERRSVRIVAPKAFLPAILVSALPLRLEVERVFVQSGVTRMMTNVLRGSSVVSLPASIVIFVTNPQVETSGRFATRTVARIAKVVFVSLLLPVRSTASVLRSVTMLCAHVPAVTNATKTTSTAFPTQGQKRLERSAQARMSVFLGPALLPAVVETITVLSVVPKTSSVLMVTSVACWNSLRSSASQNRRPKASRGTHAPEVRGIVQPTIASTTS
jgi:hypothetical protein